MLAGRCFVDTNVFLYFYDPRDSSKQHAATAWVTHLWQTGTGALSWQVLHEFYANAVRRVGIPPEAARNMVREIQVWQPLASDLRLIERAWYWSDTAQVSWWDALIVASAERLECRYLLSEDFQSGREYGSIEVVSPFEQTPPVLA